MNQLTDRNEIEIEEIWEDSLNSEDQNSDREEVLNEIDQLTATHLNPRKFTRKIKEINLNLKYTNEQDQRELAKKLKQVQTLMKQINLRFLDDQNRKFSENQIKIQKNLKNTFDSQMNELNSSQSIINDIFN